MHIHGIVPETFQGRDKFVVSSADTMGSLRPTHYSGGQWSLVQQNRRATNQRNRQYRPPLSRAERLKRVFDIDISVCPLCGGTLRVIADVTDPDAIQTILAHLRQRAPPDAGGRQRPGQGPQNDLLAAIWWLKPRQRISPYANRKAPWLIAHHQVSQSPQTTTNLVAFNH